MDHPGRVFPPSLVISFLTIMSTTKVTINEAPSGKAGCGDNSKVTAKNGKKARKARKKAANQEIKALIKEMPKGRRESNKKALKAMYKAFDYTKPHPQMAVDYLHKNYKGDLGMMAGDLDAVMGNLVKKFAAMQMNPQTIQCQVPDSDFRNSATVTETMVIDLEVDMSTTNAGVPGQFAFLVQPKFGNFGDPKKYKVAYVDPATMSNGAQATINYLSTTPYKVSDTVSNTDYRVGPTFYELTQGPPGSALFTSGASTTLNKPFGDNSNVTAVAASANLGVKYDGVTVGGTNPNGSFILPPGTYLIYTRLTAPVVTAFTYTGTAQNAPLEFFGNASTYGVLWRVTATPGSNLWSMTAAASGQASSGAVYITRTVFDDVAMNTNDGAVAAYRAAAMSCTVTPTVTAFDKGGQMAAALLPNCDANKRFFVNAAPGPEGALRSFESVAMLANKKGIRNFEEGLYIWWTQFSADDYKYQAPTDMDTYEPPTFVVAGRWTPSAGSTITGKWVVGKITIYTVYEFLTEDQSFPTQPSQGSQAIIDAVHAFYITGNDGLPFDQVLGNPEHLGWWAKVIGFLKRASYITGEVLKVAGPVLAAL